MAEKSKERINKYELALLRGNEWVRGSCENTVLRETVLLGWTTRKEEISIREVPKC